MTWGPFRGPKAGRVIRRPERSTRPAWPWASSDPGSAAGGSGRLRARTCSDAPIRIPLARSMIFRLAERQFERVHVVAERLDLTRAGHGDLDRGVETRAGHRLEQVVDHPPRDRLGAQSGVALGGQDHHRRPGVASDLSGRREAVEPGHLDVHQDQVGQSPGGPDVDRVSVRRGPRPPRRTLWRQAGLGGRQRPPAFRHQRRGS